MVEDGNNTTGGQESRLNTNTIALNFLDILSTQTRKLFCRENEQMDSVQCGAIVAA